MTDPNILTLPQQNNFFPPVQTFKGVAQGHKAARELTTQRVVYRGITESAGAQELFIDNDPEYRLTLPNQSAIRATWQGLAYNLDIANFADGTIANSGGVFTVVRHGPSGENMALTVVTAGAIFVFSINATNKSVVLNVTPGSASRMLWTCMVDIVGIGRYAAAFHHSKEFTNEP